MKFFFAVLAIAALSGCVNTGSFDSLSSNYIPSTQSTVDTESSLFSSDNVLSDKEIARILAYQLRLPKISRLAILNLSDDNRWNAYSYDFTQLNSQIASRLISKILSNPHINSASLLPTLLTPHKRTVPYLREAAARYQADLLLAYRSHCQTFQKYRFLNPDETKAYCTVEAVLLDVRTGIVPFSAVSTKEFLAKKQKSDTNFSETIKKSELSAIESSLIDIALQLTGFINQTQRQQPAKQTTQ